MDQWDLHFDTVDLYLAPDTPDSGREGRMRAKKPRFFFEYIYSDYGTGYCYDDESRSLIEKTLVETEAVVRHNLNALGLVPGVYIMEINYFAMRSMIGLDFGKAYDNLTHSLPGLKFETDPFLPFVDAMDYLLSPPEYSPTPL
jgi:hypothetical protein